MGKPIVYCRFIAPKASALRPADIGMVEHARALRGRRSAIVIVLKNGGDALVSKRPNGNGPGRNSLDTSGLDPAKELEDAETGSKGLLGMPATGEHRNDEPLCIRPDRARPAFEAFWCPFSNELMGTRHVVQVGAGAGTTIAALMNGDAIRAVEYLDDAAGNAHLHLLLEQSVRHRVQEVIDLDVIIERDAR